MKDDKYAIIFLILIIAILGIILFFKASGNLNFNFETEEKTTIAKTDIDIKNIEDSINLIMVSLKIDDTINDAKTCKTLVNYELKKNTNYQVDENGDILQRNLKVTNMEGTILNVTFEFVNHSPKASFNI